MSKPSNISDKKWQTFFEILQDITELEMPVTEKAKLVLEEAEHCGEWAETAIQELVSWPFDELI